jgi:hypothetical protein
MADSTANSQISSQALDGQAKSLKPDSEKTSSSRNISEGSKFLSGLASGSFLRVYNHLANGHTLSGTTKTALDGQEEIAIKTHITTKGLETFSDEKIKELTKYIEEQNSELAKKFYDVDGLTEEEKEQKRIFRETCSGVIKDVNEAIKERQEGDENSRNQLMARLAFSILFPGILEATEILFHALGNFGEGFPEGVAQTMKDSKVFGPFAEMFDKLELDKFGQIVAEKTPLFSDINKLVYETASSEYAQPFAEVTHGLIGSELFGLAFKSAIAGYTIANEVEVYKKSVEADDKFDQVMKKSMRTLAKMAEKNIERLAEKWADLYIDARFDTINIESLLEAKKAGLLGQSDLDKEYSVGAGFMSEKKSLKDLTDDEIKKLERPQLKKLANQAKEWFNNSKSVDNLPPETAKIIDENIKKKDEVLDVIIEKINHDKLDDKIITRDSYSSHPDNAKDAIKEKYKETLKDEIYKKMLSPDSGKTSHDSVSFKPPSSTPSRPFDGQPFPSKQLVGEKSIGSTVPEGSGSPSSSGRGGGNSASL